MVLVLNKFFLKKQVLVHKHLLFEDNFSWEKEK